MKPPSTEGTRLRGEGGGGEWSTADVDAGARRASLLQQSMSHQSTTPADHATMNRDGNTQQSNRTPPAGFTNVPLTPPQTGEESADQTSSVLHEIRSRLRTRCPHDEAWLKFDLSFAEFTALESKLENEIEAGYKLRYGKRITLSRS